MVNEVNYPGELDTIGNFPSVTEITEATGEPINRNRDAILTIEQVLGINPHISLFAGEVTVAERLNLLETGLSNGVFRLNELNVADALNVDQIDGTPDYLVSLGAPGPSPLGSVVIKGPLTVLESLAADPKATFYTNVVFTRNDPLTQSTNILIDGKADIGQPLLRINDHSGSTNKDILALDIIGNVRISGKLDAQFSIDHSKLNNIHVIPSKSQGEAYHVTGGSYHVHRKGRFDTALQKWIVDTVRQSNDYGIIDHKDLIGIGTRSTDGPDFTPIANISYHVTGGDEHNHTNGRGAQLNHDNLLNIDPKSSNHVTGGDEHNHTGGHGAQIDHTTLSNIGVNTHAQIDAALSTVAEIVAANLPTRVTTLETNFETETTNLRALIGPNITESSVKIQLTDPILVVGQTTVVEALEKIDESTGKSIQDRNIIISGGGLIMFNPNTSSITFSEDIVVEIPGTGFTAVITATTITGFTIGSYLYIELNRTTDSTPSIIKVNGLGNIPSIDQNQDIFILARRASSGEVYLYDNTRIDIDDNVAKFGKSSVALPNYYTRVFYGADTVNQPGKATIEGDLNSTSTAIHEHRAYDAIKDVVDQLLASPPSIAPYNGTVSAATVKQAILELLSGGSTVTHTHPILGVPHGGIVAWVKPPLSPLQAPLGFVICDGTSFASQGITANNLVGTPFEGTPLSTLTPNLKNRFLKGSPASTIVNYNEVAVTDAVASAGNGTLVNPTHNHASGTLVTGNHIQGAALGAAIGIDPGATVYQHNHNISGSTASVSAEPPYSFVTWIMRIY